MILSGSPRLRRALDVQQTAFWSKEVHQMTFGIHHSLNFESCNILAESKVVYLTHKRADDFS